MSDDEGHEVFYDAEEQFVGGPEVGRWGRQGDEEQDDDERSQASSHTSSSSVSEVLASRLEGAMSALERVSSSRSASSSAQSDNKHVVAVEVDGELHFMDRKLATKLSSQGSCGVRMIDQGGEGSDSHSSSSNLGEPQDDPEANPQPHQDQDVVVFKNLDTGQQLSLSEVEQMPVEVHAPARGPEQHAHRNSVIGRLFKKDKRASVSVLPATTPQLDDEIKVTVKNKPQQELSHLQLKQRMSAHTGAIWAMCFSHDCRYLATAGQDKVVCVWEIAAQESGCSLKREPLRTYPGHSADVWDLAWSKNNFLLSSSMDKTVRLWHVSHAEQVSSFQHLDFVTAVQFHPQDDKFFLSSALDERLRVWHITNGLCVKELVIGAIPTAACYSPSGALCVAGTHDGHVHVFSSQNLELVNKMDVKSSRGKNSKGSKVTGIVFTADGSQMLVTTNDSRLRLYQMHTNHTFSLLFKFKGLKNKVSPIKASFSPFSHYIVCGSEDHRIYVWNREGASLLGGPLPGKHKSPTTESFECFEVSDFVVTVALFAPAVLMARPVPDDSPLPTPAPPSPTTHTLKGQPLFSADMSGTIRVFVNDGLPRPAK